MLREIQNMYRFTYVNDVLAISICWFIFSTHFCNSYTQIWQNCRTAVAYPEGWAGDCPKPLHKNNL